MSPKVNASLLDTIPAYERFQRNAVLSNSGGKLYMYVYNQFSSSYYMSGIDLGIWNKANKVLAPWILSSSARRMTSDEQYIYHRSEGDK